jgi:hypothetical protein
MRRGRYVAATKNILKNQFNAICHATPQESQGGDKMKTSSAQPLDSLRS